MKITSKLSLSLIGALSLVALSAPVALADEEAMEPLPTVEYVDLNRYVGLWYEIAYIPSVFEWGCHATTATYTARADGAIDVANGCNMFWPNGPLRVAEGVATVVDTTTNAKLSVIFPPAPTGGDYWVIGLDPDYQWAMVGEPSRNYFWILARTPNMSSALYESLVAEAEALGYDSSEFVKTQHPRKP